MDEGLATTPGIDAPVGDGGDIGRVTCYKLDEGWIPVIAIGKEEVQLEPRHGPGEAVDAAFKWAKDRGMILTFPSMVIRNKP